MLPFIAGAERLLSRNTKFGFHQYSFPGISNTAFVAEYTTDRTYLRSRASVAVDKGGFG